MKNDSITSTKGLSSIRKKHKNKKIVLAGGGFDLLHPGHLKQLEWAKLQGDILVVHITSEKRFTEKKKRKPIFSERERAHIIASLKPVDYVFIYNGRHFDQKIIDLLQPDILTFNQEAFLSAKKEIKQLNFEGKILISRFKKEYSCSIILAQA